MFEKRKYHTIPISALNPHNPNEVWSAKIDGAHTAVQAERGKMPRLFSHRTSKRTGGLIEYTQKLPHIREKSPINAVFRAETYAVDAKGRVVPPETVTALLNSKTERSLAMQDEQGLQTRTAIIDVDKYEGEDLTNAPWDVKRRYIGLLSRRIPGFTLPDTAATPEKKESLLKSILDKRHPQTKEGLIVHHLHDVERPFTKAKVVDHHDVYVTGIFPEEDVKHGRAPMAGGFYYAWEPDGKPVGKVGTGFSHEMKKDMLANPNEYIGRAAKVKALDLSKNKVLVKPSFGGWHVEKNLKEASVFYKIAISSELVARKMMPRLHSYGQDITDVWRKAGGNISLKPGATSADPVSRAKMLQTVKRTQQLYPKELTHKVASIMQPNFELGFEKAAKDLTTAARSHISSKNFALSKERKYPIEDKAHARNALARVSQFGSPSEKAEVRRDVHAKYPDIGRK